MLILGLAAVVGTSVWAASQALENPGFAPSQTTPDDASRAQQKLFRLIRGATTDPIVLTEAELNAFVSRNIDPGDLPFDHPVVFLHDGDVVEIVGSLPLRRLVADSPLGIVAGVLPDPWGARPIWLQISARAQFEQRARPQLRLAVQRLTIGRQRLPTLALRLLFEPARLRFVRVSVPETVGEIRIQTGRVVIRPTSLRERT